jgi:hypothetical protein
MRVPDKPLVWATDILSIKRGPEQNDRDCPFERRVRCLYRPSNRYILYPALCSQTSLLHHPLGPRVERKDENYDPP